MMAIELVGNISLWLMAIMQLSILVPMVVVLRRRGYFSPVIRLLSWYVFLSAFFALSARAAAIYLQTNLLVLIGFNVAKVLLLGAVYWPVLKNSWLRKALGLATISGLGMVVASIVVFGTAPALTVSRVVQCTVLAGFALAYLEQQLSRTDGCKPSHDPLWLLSLGQLIYSAATITAFSGEILFNFQSPQLTIISAICVSLANLAFNFLLTVAFLRAAPVAPAPATGSALVTP